MQSTGLITPSRPRLRPARHQHRPHPEVHGPLGVFMVLCLTAGPLRHVAGRAHHPARHRPGHEHPDLRQRGRRIPSGGKAIYEEGGSLKFTIILVISIALLVFIVFMDQGQRRIRYLRETCGGPPLGRRAPPTSAQGEPGGVIPIIFASSVLYIPVLLSNILPNHAFQNFVRNSIQPTSFFYIGCTSP